MIIVNFWMIFFLNILTNRSVDAGRVLRPVGREALAGLISGPDPLEVGGVGHHSQVLDILVSHVLGF